MCVETNLYRNLCVLEIVCVIHLLPLLAGFEAHILLFFFLAEKKKKIPTGLAYLYLEGPKKMHDAISS